MLDRGLLPSTRFRAKLFVFLRERRHENFDEALQEELGTLYSDSRLGHPPVAPAKLALATILQTYTGASTMPRSHPSPKALWWPSARG